ncbi:hypothetical protein C8T65DRAFT_647019 [Cerioporus squamosus]|nr:hypothetical protein C8T65DRAFT_647019 [Cerioporus squamosus]
MDQVCFRLVLLLAACRVMFGDASHALQPSHLKPSIITPPGGLAFVLGSLRRDVFAQYAVLSGGFGTI